MSPAQQKKLLNKATKLEQYFLLGLKEATAIRKELEGGTSSSPKRGKKIAERVTGLRSRTLLRQQHEQFSRSKSRNN